jgi:hypothetical protein
MSNLREATDQILAKADLTRAQLFVNTVEKTLGPLEMPINGNASTPKAPDGSTATGAEDGNSGANASNDQQAPSESSESTPQKAKRTERGAKDEQAIDGLLGQRGTDVDEHPRIAKPNLADLLRKRRGEGRNNDQA